MVGAEQLAEKIGIFDRAVVERWEQVARFLVEPVPTTFAGLLEEAREATTGTRPDDDAEGLAELNRYRATHSLAAEVRHVSPSERELVDCWPDLRGEIATAEVSGASIRRAQVEEVPWPDRAA
jgi:hypothetical protein